MQGFRRKLALAAGVFAALFSAPLHAQTAVRLEALLEKPAVTWADVTGFVLEASEASERAVYNSPAGAFTFAVERNWLPKGAALTDTVRYNGLALLLMESFGLKGGIFYGIAKSPHHAYRELVYKRVIRGDADPLMVVSGQEFLLMISRILSIQEKGAGS